MRGQYRVTVPVVQVGTSEVTILGIIVPANTIIKPVAIHLEGGATAANSVRWRLRRLATGTQSLSNANTPTPVDSLNSIASAVSFGDRGAAGTGNVWSAEPASGDWGVTIVGGRFEAFGGQDERKASLPEELASLGGTSEQRYGITAIAASAVDCTLTFTFNE